VWRVFLWAVFILIASSLSLKWTLATSTLWVYSAILMWAAWSTMVLTVAIIHSMRTIRSSLASGNNVNEPPDQKTNGTTLL
jgi:HAMP domain-containing protein